MKSIKDLINSVVTNFDKIRVVEKWEQGSDYNSLLLDVSLRENVFGIFSSSKTLVASGNSSTNIELYGQDNNYNEESAVELSNFLVSVLGNDSYGYGKPIYNEINGYDLNYSWFFDKDGNVVNDEASEAIHSDIELSCSGKSVSLGITNASFFEPSFYTNIVDRLPSKSKEFLSQTK